MKKQPGIKTKFEEVENNIHSTPIKRSKCRKGILRETDYPGKKCRSVSKSPTSDIRPAKWPHKTMFVSNDSGFNETSNQINIKSESQRQELPKKRWLREASLDKSLHECTSSSLELNQVRPTVLMLANKDDKKSRKHSEHSEELVTEKDVFPDTFVGFATPKHNPSVDLGWYTNSDGLTSSTPTFTVPVRPPKSLTPIIERPSFFSSCTNSQIFEKRKIPQNEEKWLRAFTPALETFYSDVNEKPSLLPIQENTQSKCSWSIKNGNMNQWNYPTPPESSHKDKQKLQSALALIQLSKTEEELALPLPVEDDSLHHLCPLNLSQDRFTQL